MNNPLILLDIHVESLTHIFLVGAYLGGRNK